MEAEAYGKIPGNLCKPFKGKTIVIKYGGSVTKDIAADAFTEDIAVLHKIGARIVVVHGGGPDINNMLFRLDIKSEFVRGLRVTEAAAMEIVEMVLSGRVNKELTSKLLDKGIDAVGISGRDGRLIEAKKMYLYEDDRRIDIGFVGAITAVNIKIVSDLLNMGYVVVISPVAGDREGNVYNINADYAAASVGISLNADRLVYLSDVNGLYGDINDRDSLIKTITAAEIEELIRNGKISGGMIPKMMCCTEAIKKGVKSVCLIDGRKAHALLELMGGKSTGTIIKGGEKYA